MRMHSLMTKIAAVSLASALLVGSAIADSESSSSSSSSSASSVASSVSSSSVSSSSSKSKKFNVDVVCIQSAIGKRDTAIITALDTYYGAVKAALTTRENALKSAWAKPTASEQKAALKSAWQAYKSSIKTARFNFKMAKQQAWKTYNADAKLCKVPGSGEDGGGQGTDSQL